MKAIDRIFQYINFKGLNKSEFERNTSISNGYLAKQLQRKADIGESILISILEYCPEINPEWLLTGKGNMLKEADIKTVSQSIVGNNNQLAGTGIKIKNNQNNKAYDYQNLINTISDLKKQIENRDKMINKLIEQQDKLISKLTNS